ncbi:nitrite reductase small subunit NirD [Knoellia sp. 3-2P3]|uniref:nitrite reductase small subunit NirD n=1 Tax=unclassified Knoellia TaxID=2618719 RepID=UPI0023D9CE6E|nr:nitrite reductase small subunit NirD [Knoellia sp. 3-2P3]MDF2092954.1 nitrite reductase small subunit NirD [Knoellia sp. 3-2P3]
MTSTPTTTPPAAQVPDATWEEVCHLDDLPRERGVAALVDGLQVALFRTHDDAVHALQQYDPYCGAHVISRGIVGSRGSVPTVASPMYKQVFDLRTGACLDPVGREPVHLTAYPVEVRDGVVLVAREPLPAPGAP